MRVFGVTAFSRSEASMRKPREESAFHKHGIAAGKADEIGVAGPVGAGQQHVVAVVEHDEERIGQRLLAAGGENDVFRLCRHLVLTLKIMADSVAGFHDAVDGGVFGEVFVNGLFGGFTDVKRSGGVGFSHGQTGDGYALRLQFKSLGIDGKCGGGLDFFHSLGKVHGCASWLI